MWPVLHFVILLAILASAGLVALGIWEFIKRLRGRVRRGLGKFVNER